MSERMDLRERISVDPGMHFGKPCVKGTRIPVESVLELVEQNIAFDVIARDFYPDLAIEDIQACVAYAREIVRSEEIRTA